MGVRTDHDHGEIGGGERERSDTFVCVQPATGDGGCFAGRRQRTDHEQRDNGNVETGYRRELQLVFGAVEHQYPVQQGRRRDMDDAGR